MPLWIVVVIGLLVSSLVGGTIYTIKPQTNIDDTVVILGRPGVKDDVVGAGVIVDRDGGILTAAHVAQVFNGGMVLVTLNYEVESPNTGEMTNTLVGRIVWESEIADLAYIQVDAVVFHTKAKIADDYAFGDAIEIVGHPRGNTWLHTWGRVAAEQIMGHPGGRWEGYWIVALDAVVMPGNSGGGVFNEDGELIGILSAGWMGMMEASASISMAIPQDVICRLLLCR